MTQTVLIQNMAIEHVHQQIEQLQQQVSRGGPPAPQNSPGFLSGGPNRQSTWGTRQRLRTIRSSSLVLTIRRPLTRRYPLHQARKAADRVFCAVRRRPQLVLRPERLPLREFAPLFGGVGRMAGFGGPSGSQFFRVVATVRAGPVMGAASGRNIVNNYYDSPEQQGGGRDEDTSDRTTPIRPTH